MDTDAKKTKKYKVVEEEDDQPAPQLEKPEEVRQDIPTPPVEETLLPQVAPPAFLDQTSTPGPAKKKIALIIIGFILLASLIAGGVFLFTKSSRKTQGEKVSQSASKPTPITTLEPTKVPQEAKVDLSAFSLKILNGSGVKGEAAKLKAILENAKFKVNEIGNAATSDYPKTVIKAKKAVASAFIDELKTNISKLYALADLEEAGDSQSSDVVIIIGSQKSE